MAKKALLNLMFVFLCSALSAAYASDLGVLNPKGIIAFRERKLMLDTLALMLIVVLPVIIMSFAFAYRYKESKHIGRYKPEWCHNTLLEAFWWGIPAIIIIILSVITWNKTHELDPYQSIKKGEKELVQVVALRWKWLFIYPREGIATVNELYMPENREVEFHITADAPMSSFDIPQLGGQIYAMAGMRTRLHLHSTHKGTYNGLNTHLNGDGFSDMHFSAHVVSKREFKNWTKKIKGKETALTLKTYKKLFEPSIPKKAQQYSSVPKKLFAKVMKQYTEPNSWLHDY